MSATILLKFLSKQFDKASMLAKFALLFCLAFGYCILNLYQSISVLNDKIIACHEARMKDQNALFDRVNTIDTKIKTNTDGVNELKKELKSEIGYSK